MSENCMSNYSRLSRNCHDIKHEVKDFSMQTKVFKGKAEVTGKFTQPLPGTSNLYTCYSSESKNARQFRNMLTAGLSLQIGPSSMDQTQTNSSSANPTPGPT